MQIVVVKKENLYKYPFPKEFINDYWIKDFDEFGNERDLIQIQKTDKKWILVSNDNCKILDNNQELNNIEITLNKFYFLKIITKNSTVDAMIYVCEANDVTYESYQLEDGEYTIGSASNQNIILNNGLVSSEHAILIKQNNKYLIKSKDDNYGIYVNDRKEINKVLENGDIIFIMGYKIIILNSYLIINNNKTGITINTPKIIKKELCS